MRVVHAAHGFFPEGSGGVESYVRDLARAQLARGDDVRLWTGSLAARSAVELEPLELEGVPAWRVHRDDLYFDHFAKLWHPGVERVLRELFARERPELLHVHHWIRLTGNLVEIAADAGVPAIVTLHDVAVTCPRCFRVDRDGRACARPLGVASCRDCVPRFGHESSGEIAASIEVFADQLRAELDGAAAVVVADGATAALVEAQAGFPRARCDVVPMPRATHLGPRRGGGGGALRFGHWGSIAAHKGVVDLLQAFARIAADAGSPPVELAVFGPIATPSLERELRALANGLPVVFHGAYAPADLVDAGLDVAVFPSLAFETWSFALDEALDLGLPVVLSDVGAPAARAGAAALLVPPGDPDALADAMRRLRDDPGLRDGLARAARPTALTMAAHLAGLDAVYARAAAAGVRAGAWRIDPLRRAELLFLQRESAQGRICPDGGPR